MYQFEAAVVAVGVDADGVGTMVILPGSAGLGVDGVVGFGSTGGVGFTGGVVGVVDTAGGRSITAKVVK